MKERKIARDTSVHGNPAGAEEKGVETVEDWEWVQLWRYRGSGHTCDDFARSSR